MSELQLFLRAYTIVPVLFCAIIGLIKYNEVKNTHWKWLVYYIVTIFILEGFSVWFLEYYQEYRKNYYNYFVIPFQFLFFYWLYAFKEFNNKRLFWIICLIYFLLFVIVEVFNFEKTRIINSTSYSIGVLLLFYLVLKEFFIQIQSDKILEFTKNKMFYINIGVALFYVGTLPFFAFDGFAYENTVKIWWNYFTLFQLLNYFFYLILAASFIWGKPHS